MGSDTGVILPKPKLVVKVVLAHEHGVEAKTTRYTEDEMSDILNKREPFFFYAEDENDQPVKIVIKQPDKIMAFILMDYGSYEKTMQRAQFLASRGAPRGPLVPG